MIINVRGNVARALDTVSDAKEVVKGQLRGLREKNEALDLGDTGFSQPVMSESLSEDGRTRVFNYAPAGVEVPFAPQHDEFVDANRAELDGIRNQVIEQAVASGHSPEVVQEAMALAQIHDAVVPVRLENGHLAYARANRVTYAHGENDPSQGGLRFLGSNTLEQTQALALGQHNKNAGAGLSIEGKPIVGAKGAVGTIYDPQAPEGEQFIPAEKLSLLEKQRVASNLLRTIGIDYAWDGLAPDMNSNSEVMRAIAQTYEDMLKEQGLPARPAPVTSKPVERSRFWGRVQASGGTLVRDRATGLGVLHMATAAAKKEGLNLKGAVTVVQGAGNVGMWYARLATRAGMKLGGISDINGAVRFQPPLDALGVRKLARHVQNGGSVATFQHPSAHPISNDDLWSLPADILVPAAGAHALNEETLPRVLSEEALPPSGKRKIIPEGGNEATNGPGEKILDANKDRVVSLPGLAANPGGVFASGNIERLQNLKDKTISLRQGQRMIKKMMFDQYERIFDRADKDGISIRNAAYREASDEVIQRSKRADPVVTGPAQP